MIYGIHDSIKIEHFVEPNSIRMFLLASHFFCTLPNYLPQQTLTFTCFLHDVVSKEISISNTSTKPITYLVYLEAHKNFSSNIDVLKLEPGKSGNVTITFNASLSRTLSGRIILRNRKNGYSPEGALVFELKSQVVGRQALSSHVVNNVKLYELGKMEILVANPFEEDANFTVMLRNIKKVKVVEKKRKHKSSKNEIEGKEKIVDSMIPCFFSKENKISIKKQACAKLQIHYQPLSFESHFAQIIFVDENVGEIQHDIKGTPKMPSQMQKFKLQTSIENQDPFEISIPRINDKLFLGINNLINHFVSISDLDQLKNLKEFVEKETNISTKKLKGFELYGITSQMSSQNEETMDRLKERSSRSRPRSKSRSMRKNLKNRNLFFSIIPNSYISGPEFIDVVENTIEKRKDHDTVTINLNPQCKVPMKNMNLKVNLKSENKVDIRMLEIDLTINPKIIKFYLEMETNAKKQICQSIPIPNSNSFDVNIKPSFEILEGELTYFDMNLKNFKIKKKSVEHFNLNFLPIWIEKCKAKLTFYNQNTNEKTIYEINAVSNKPLNEEVICLKTCIKQDSVISVPLKNFTDQSIEYKIETDIPNAIHEKKVVIKPKHQIDFSIKFLLNKSGEFHHKIKFIDKNNHYIWFMAKIQAEGNNIIELKDEIHSFIRIKMEDNNIFGPKMISLNSLEEKEIDFEYRPIHPERKKVRIGFISETTENIWYEVIVHSEQSLPSKLKPIEAEIGKNNEQTLTFRNPFKNKLIKFNSKIIFKNKNLDLWKSNETQTHIDKSNKFSKNYSNLTENNLIERKWNISPKNFELKPGRTKKIKIKYVPDDIEKEDRIGLEFFSQELGLFQYEVYGKGCLPTVSELKRYFTEISSVKDIRIPFQNPFSNEVDINISIKEKNENQEKKFTIQQSQKTSFRMQKFEKIDIPILFNTKTLGKFNSIFKLVVDSRINFEFPIEVETECDMSKKWPIQKIKIKANSSIQKKLNFFLDEIIPGFTLFEKKKIEQEQKIKKSSKIKSKKFSKLNIMKELRESENIINENKENLLNLSKRNKNKKSYLLESENRSIQSDENEKNLSSSNPDLKKDNIELLSLFPQINTEIIDAENISFFIAESEQKQENKIGFELLSSWLDTKFLQSEANSPGEISFLFDFYPAKPFSSIIYFYVVLNSGGRWKFKLMLESLEPKFYDVLNIYTSLNTKKGIQFQLNGDLNIYEQEFNAFFKKDSDPGFEVTPQSGVLHSSDEKGTLFTVTFMPFEYGKVKKAKLVIETETQYYLLLVKGKFRKYSPPQKN